MNAALVTSFDTPPRYATFDAPIPQQGEHLVTVTAAGLHQIVRSLASGSHYGSTGLLPFIPGVDGVGRLQSAAGNLPAGTRIYFGVPRPPFGTFAEQAIASGRIMVPIPDGLDDATAAGIANPAMSSWVALDRAGFTPGDSVLIVGATGVAGLLAVQIAKRRGAKRVIATGRNPEALAQAKTLGADVTISLDQPTETLVAALRAEFDSRIDVVLDYVWGAPAEAVLQAIAKKGLINTSNRVRYVNIGSGAGADISLPAATLRSANLEILGSGFGSASLDDILKAVANFFDLMVKEPLAFNLKTAPLSDIESLWSVKEQSTRLVFIP